MADTLVPLLHCAERTASTAFRPAARRTGNQGVRNEDMREASFRIGFMRKQLAQILLPQIARSCLRHRSHGSRYGLDIAPSRLGESTSILPRLNCQ